jgi:thiamine biosynthesis lipoprotein
MNKYSFLIWLLILTACASELKSPITISGQAQGTTYTISYLAGAYSNYRAEIDSIFKAIDQSLSTYQKTSLISRINRNETNVVDEHFKKVFQKSMEVSVNTGGLFDVSVFPLVNAYGFGFKKRESLDQAMIDSILKLVGYQKIQLNGNILAKANPSMMIDFNAIAQGYTVDVLADFLDKKGIKDYLIELGGEVRSKGKKLDAQPWTVGIEEPEENNAEGGTLNRTIVIQNQALATSGNYKKFYVEDGRKFTHILDPFTGYPAKNNLLSATVVAPDCMTADAYATAFMVMGLDRAKAFLDAHQNLQLSVFFIYDEQGDTKTYISQNFPALAR